VKILVCPLDWGLGHATRCIPLIRALLSNGHQVRVGAAGGGLILLRGEFPELDVFEFPGYRVRYSASPRFFLPVMLWQLPRVLSGMRGESRRLEKILADHPADVVISDGRYGVRPKRLPGIFITHQVFIRIPGRFPGLAWAERFLLALNLRRLRAFDAVWVPDFPGADSLSGELSHKPGAPPGLEFIHPLSRFGAGAVPGPEVDVLAVVSGPEPQRTLFERILRNQMSGMQGTRVLVRGLPGTLPAASLLSAASLKKPSIVPGGLTEFDHLSGTEMAGLFGAARMIVARSGYTTVMELAGLGARAALLVPTPGQSEQEYLADHLERAGAAIRMDQHSIDLRSARKRLAGLPGFSRWLPGSAGGSTGPFSLRAFIAAHPIFRPPPREPR
jgi:glycosyl transferase family 28